MDLNSSVLLINSNRLFSISSRTSPQILRSQPPQSINTSSRTPQTYIHPPPLTMASMRPIFPHNSYPWHLAPDRECHCAMFHYPTDVPHYLAQSTWYQHQRAWRVQNRLPARSGTYPTSCAPGREKWMVYIWEDMEYREVSVATMEERERAWRRIWTWVRLVDGGVSAEEEEPSDGEA
jgi:hypothetical protein